MTQSTSSRDGRDGHDLAGKPRTPAAPLDPSAFELSITRTFDAPVALVFSIWSSREHMLQWWGPKNFTTKEVELDFRVGGTYRACIVSQAGRESWMRGTFREIAKERRIVMTFNWEERDDLPVDTLITVTFTEEGGKTVQHFHQAPFPSAASRDDHTQGWSSFCDRENDYLGRIAR